MVSTRQAAGDDVAFLAEVFLRAMRIHITAARGFWDESRERRQFREQLDLHHTRIIEHNGVSVGFLMALPHGEDIEIHTFCIAPENQGQGFGTAITRQVLDDARIRRCGVVLSVLKANKAARSLYERLGFVVIEETDHHYRMRHVS